MLVSALAALTVRHFRVSDNSIPIREGFAIAGISTPGRVPFGFDWWDQSGYAGTPFAGGATNDPAHQPGRPNANGGTVTGYPPDRNYPAWNGTDTSNNVRPLSVISGLLIERVTPTIGAAGLGISVTAGSSAGLSSDSNNFVSAFAAYHAVWYQSFASSSWLPYACRIQFVNCTM